MKFVDFEPYGPSYRERRATYEEANQFLYAENNETPGSTTYAPEIFRYLSDPDKTYEDLDYFIGALPQDTIGSCIEALEERLDEIDEDLTGDGSIEARSLQDHLWFIQKAADVIESVQAKSDSEDARETFVASVTQEVLAEYNSEAHVSDQVEVFDAKNAPLDLTEKILVRYAQKLQEILAEEDWPHVVNEARISFVQAINTPNMRQRMGNEARQRAAMVAEQTPILIIDPLSSLMRRNQDYETLGKFSGDKRTIAIDPFSSQKSAESCFSPDTPSETIRAVNRIFVLEAVFHELIHGATNADYIQRSYEHELNTEFQISYNHALWPRFWREGMTEKLAYSALAEILPASELPRTRFNESIQRRVFSYDPKQVGLPKKAVDLQKHIPSAYFDDRNIIDTVYQKLDWAAAGLTWSQAEKLATKAFTEVPHPDAKGAAKSARLAFIEAVNLAAYPGFFMKLATLVEFCGPTLVGDIITHPSFDPHDPHVFPYIASTAQNQAYPPIQSGEKRVKHSAERVQRLKVVGAPNVILQNSIELVEFAKYQLAQRRALNLATSGLRTMLEQRHPKRKPLVEKARLMAAIGMAVAPKFEHRPEVELTAAQDAIEQWVVGQRNMAQRKSS